MSLLRTLLGALRLFRVYRDHYGLRSAARRTWRNRCAWEFAQRASVIKPGIGTPDETNGGRSQ